MLVMLSGLPGVGKSAIADALGQRLPAVVISVDPIEAAILRCGIPRSFETGVAAYEVGAVVAEHQLRHGLHVVADAANYLEVGRNVWRAAAERAGVATRAVEIVCGDEREHRQRVESRRRALEPYPELDWDAVLRRRAEVEPWPHDVLTLDSVRPIDDNVAEALAYLNR
jgi:predicted kinase